MNTVFYGMKECLELRGLSDNTQRNYLRIVRQFSEYFNKSPENSASVTSRIACFICYAVTALQTPLKLITPC